MKLTQFIIFISIVFSIYFAVNYYIYIRGLQAIPAGSTFRLYYRIIFLVFALSFIASRLLERMWISSVTEVLVWIGDIWLGAILYLFLFILLLDILRLGNYLFHYFPAFISTNYVKAKIYTFITVNSAVFIILLAGYINAVSPRIKEININIDKKAGNLKTLTIAMASDIHLGWIIANGRLTNLVDKINSLNPDIILLPGDIVDESLTPVLKYNLGENLRKLKAKFGVFAITGNHEYIGGAEKAVKYCEEHGVRFLRDRSILIDSSFYIVGREDRDIKRFAGKDRKLLHEIMNSIDRNLPVILMDHQPFKLEEAENEGVDLQLSGHTHHGQLWPFNYITNAVYELSWGFKKKGNTNYYVSCGYGTWGPPFRTGNRPEIVKFNINFK